MLGQPASRRQSRRFQHRPRSLPRRGWLVDIPQRRGTRRACSAACYGRSFFTLVRPAQLPPRGFAFSAAKFDIGGSNRRDRGSDGPVPATRSWKIQCRLGVFRVHPPCLIPNDLISLEKSPISLDFATMAAVAKLWGCRAARPRFGAGSSAAATHNDALFRHRRALKVRWKGLAFSGGEIVCVAWA